MVPYLERIEDFILPMAAQHANLDKIDEIRDDTHYIVEAKLDGQRGNGYLGGPAGRKGTVSKKTGLLRFRVFSRQISKFTGLPSELTALVPHIVKEMQTRLPAHTYNNSVFDFEIVHRAGFIACREIMGSDKERALAMQFGLGLWVDEVLSSNPKRKLVDRLIAERKKKNLPVPTQVVFFENKHGKTDCAPFYGPVHLVVFDVLRLGGFDYVEVKSSLRTRVTDLNRMFLAHFADSEHIKQSVRYPAGKWGSKYYRLVVAAGGEGVMYKDLRAPYLPSTWDAKNERVKESRTKHYLKHKKAATFDVVIIGYEAPKKYSVKVGQKVATLTKFYKKGWIGALYVGVYENGELVKVGRCSGMTDPLRKEISENKEAFLGQVIEVEAHALNEGGRTLSHPRFNRRRPDKNAEECTMQAFRDAGKNAKRK